ncbi:hypothetical protein Lpp71_12555, partial [Lacticaseibacillus paracasei subsp. paracasei Lpp71]
ILPHSRLVTVGVFVLISSSRTSDSLIKNGLEKGGQLTVAAKFGRLGLPHETRYDRTIRKNIGGK